MPSSHPTAKLPPAPVTGAHLAIANQLMLLAHDLRMGRVSEADQILIVAMIRVVNAPDGQECGAV
jgi:hypothetical protein